MGGYGYLRVLLQSRETFKISNLTARKSIYCEAISAGDNYQKRHVKQVGCQIEDQSTALIINQWYRMKLGIVKTQVIEHLEIIPCNNPWGQLRASLDHPQNIVRIASQLCILSVVLGIIGICFGLRGLC